MSLKNTSIAILIVVIIALLFSGGEEDKHDTGVHWGYKGEMGADKWAELDEKFYMCSEGKNQSPIDIVNSYDTRLPEMSFTNIERAHTFLNNGHTVQANFSSGNSVEINGEKFDLLQMHFHTPSENHIDGKSYPMEAHLVHANKNGDLAVLGVMFEEGKEQSLLINKLLRNFPENSGDKNSLKSTILGYEILPENKEYYTFTGSLTTPPCSEGVRWFVFKNSVKISADQISDFSKALGTYP